MNKKQALKDINILIENIKHNLKVNSIVDEDMYINSWVIGTLEMIKSKIEDGNNSHVYPSDATYESLFGEFVHYYFTTNCSNRVRIYVINILWNGLTLHYIYNLFNSLMRERLIKKEKFRSCLEYANKRVHSTQDTWILMETLRLYYGA